MRDFFINSFGMLVNILVVCMIIIVVAATLVSVVSEGILFGLLVLVGGAFYVVLTAGFMYIGLGIYENTKRMADKMTGYE